MKTEHKFDVFKGFNIWDGHIVNMSLQLFWTVLHEK